jgi:hypothetical protein
MKSREYVKTQVWRGISVHRGYQATGTSVEWAKNSNGKAGMAWRKRLKWIGSMAIHVIKGNIDGS